MSDDKKKTNIPRDTQTSKPSTQSDGWTSQPLKNRIYGFKIESDDKND